VAKKKPTPNPKAKAGAPGRPGPPPRRLTDEERTKFIGYLRLGLGVRMAASKMGVSWERIDRERKESVGFAAAVSAAKAECIENLVALRYSQAIGGDGRALEFLIARADRARQFAEEMRLRRAAQQQAHPTGVTIKVEYPNPEAAEPAP